MTDTHDLLKKRPDDGCSLPVVPRRTVRDPWVSTGLRLRRSLMEEIDRVTEKSGHSRNAVFSFLLEAALVRYEAERAAAALSPPAAGSASSPPSRPDR